MVKWFDGYDGEDTMIIEDVPKGAGNLIYDYKIWLDDYIIKAEIKGLMSEIKLKTIIITSNFCPSDAFCCHNAFKNEFTNCNVEDLKAIMMRITHVWKFDNPHYMDASDDFYHVPIVYEQKYDIHGNFPTFALLSEQVVDYTLFQSE